MLVVGGDLGPHNRQLPHVLGLHGAGILPAGESCLTGRTGRRVVVAERVDVVGIRGGALVARMARLATSLTPTRGARGAGWGRGRIGGGRLGGVLGMLLEPRAQLADLLFQRNDPRQGGLMLQLEILHDLHQSTHDGRDTGRCLRSVSFRDTQSLR